MSLVDPYRIVHVVEGSEPYHIPMTIYTSLCLPRMGDLPLIEQHREKCSSVTYLPFNVTEPRWTSFSSIQGHVAIIRVVLEPTKSN